MTRLVDLDPHWLMYQGRRVGFVFRSPLPDKRPTWWQTCFVEQFNLFSFGGDQGIGYDPETGTTADSQCRIVWEALGERTPQWQGCDKACAWTIAGGIEAASFETITVTPSLDGSKGGLWHGFITNGVAQ